MGGLWPSAMVGDPVKWRTLGREDYGDRFVSEKAIAAPQTTRPGSQIHVKLELVSRAEVSSSSC